MGGMRGPDPLQAPACYPSSPFALLFPQCKIRIGEEVETFMHRGWTSASSEYVFDLLTGHPLPICSGCQGQYGCRSIANRLVLVIERLRRWLAKIRLDDQTLPSPTVQIER